MTARPVIQGTLRYKIAQFFLSLLYGRKWHYIAPWEHIGCGNGAVLFHNGKALVVKRSPDILYHPNKLSMVGGYLSPRHDTSIIQGLYREIREEVGLNLAEGRITLAHNLVHIDNMPNHTTPDQGPHHQLNFQFALVLTPEEVQQLQALDETVALYWLTLDEITALCHAGEFAYPHEYIFYQRAFTWLAQQK